MARNFRDKRQFSTETVHLGTFVHPAGDLLVLNLEHKDIPYPNSAVLFNKKQIGKVDEVFGPVGDVYVAVKPDPSIRASEFRLETRFEGYKDRFIPSNRFLPREEVERKKEQSDKKNKDSKSAGRQKGGKDPRRDEGGKQRESRFRHNGGTSKKNDGPRRNDGGAGHGNRSPGHRKGLSGNRK